MRLDLVSGRARKSQASSQSFTPSSGRTRRRGRRFSSSIPGLPRTSWSWSDQREMPFSPSSTPTASDLSSPSDTTGQPATWAFGTTEPHSTLSWGTLGIRPEGSSGSRFAATPQSEGHAESTRSDGGTISATGIFGIITLKTSASTSKRAITARAESRPFSRASALRAVIAAASVGETPA